MSFSRSSPVCERQLGDGMNSAPANEAAADEAEAGADAPAAELAALTAETNGSRSCAQISKMACRKGPGRPAAPASDAPDSVALKVMSPTAPRSSDGRRYSFECSRPDDS